MAGRVKPESLKNLLYFQLCLVNGCECVSQMCCSLFQVIKHIHQNMCLHFTTWQTSSIKHHARIVAKSLFVLIKQYSCIDIFKTMSASERYFM